MQDLYKKFPYNQKSYNAKFISLNVINSIHEFCKNHKVIEKVYAKGSIIYGTMIPGSDIDHLRIKVNKPLTIMEKIKLVEELEEHLKKYDISKIQRIKEDNYIRVFYDYLELINLPKALTIKDEIYPNIHVLTAKSKKDFKKKLYKRAYKYSNILTENWIKKTKERIDML